MSIPSHLLEKLTTNISKSEIDGFTLRFEEYRDESILVMLEKIKDDNQVVRNNAAAVLSQIGDHRIFTQFMTFLEQELKWGSEPYLSRYVRSITRHDPETQRLMLAELEKYLEQNPIVPRVDEQKYKNFFTIIDNLWIIRDPYVISMLEKLILRPDQLLDIPHRALLALSNIDRERASISLRNFMGLGLSSGKDISIYTHRMKVLNIHKKSAEHPDYFSISVWARDEYRSKESHYRFKHENGLVYFVYGGTDKRFAGQAQNDEDAIQVATEYLAWWLSSINAI